MGEEPGRDVARKRPRRGRTKLPDLPTEEIIAMRRECAWETFRDVFMPYCLEAKNLYKPTAVALLRQLLEELEGRV